MRALAEEFLSAVEYGTFVQQEECNRAFHHEMLQTCPNRDLVELNSELRDRIPLSIQREKYNTSMLKRSANEHFAMIKLLENGDKEGLASLVRSHALGALASPSE